jgi:hypothetical protein
LEIPPQDVDCWNSSSRTDARGYFVWDIFSCLGLWCLVHLSTSTLTRDFICSPWSDSELLLTNAHTDYQVKRAQVKGHSGSQPADARPLDSNLKVTFTRTSFNLLSHPRNIGSSGWENEDQSLFKQPLPQDFGCGDQGRRSKRPTLPDQLWVLSRASDTLSILPHPPSLRNIFTDFLILAMGYGC